MGRVIANSRSLSALLQGRAKEAAVKLFSDTVCLGARVLPGFNASPASPSLFVIDTIHIYARADLPRVMRAEGSVHLLIACGDDEVPTLLSCRVCSEDDSQVG